MRIDSILTILDKPKHEQLALARAVTLADRAQVPLTLAAFCWQPLADRGAEFTPAVRDALLASGLTPSRLDVEITE